LAALPGARRILGPACAAAERKASGERTGEALVTNSRIGAPWGFAEGVGGGSGGGVERPEGENVAAKPRRNVAGQAAAALVDLEPELDEEAERVGL